MNSDPPPLPGRQRKATRIALVLLLAFAPAAMFLGMDAFVRDVSFDMFATACVLSVLFCFASSFLLFGRCADPATSVVLTFIVGMLLMILNAVIAFGAACGFVGTHNI
jgi:hypothetical protein